MVTAKPLDLAIIGSGPAALSAAIYSAREGLSVTIFEKSAYGGKLNEIESLENYPGFTGSGAELLQKMRSQAESFGAQFAYGECTSIDPLIIDDREVLARAVIVATGSEPKKLDLPDVDPARVSYCATCDSPLYKDKDVLVIGGGDSAASGALAIAKFARQITLWNRSPLRASSALQNQLKSTQNIRIEIGGSPDTSADGIFVFIGQRPATAFLPDSVLDADGYIKTNTDYETVIPGVYAVGDCRSGSPRQVITAAAEGAAAAMIIGKMS